MVTYEINNINVNTIWNKFEQKCIKEAKASLGISKGQFRNIKDPAWWNDEVKNAVSIKKKHFKVWQGSGREEDQNEYIRVNKEAKLKVAQTKQRNGATLDIKINKYIKDEFGHLLTSNSSINKRWYQYYRELLSEEFPSQPLEKQPNTSGPLQAISVAEVTQAIKRMKKNKATGPDSVPADLWKLLGPVGVHWLAKLFNHILHTHAIPDAWRRSYIIPFYKNKGDISDCNNYRGVKLTSHTLKIWERILHNRLHQLVTISEQQHGFTRSKSTTDDIQTIRIIMEKHRLNCEDLHLVFIDLEKALDRVPRKLVWHAMRAQCIPEHYIVLVQDMYDRVTTQVKSMAGLSKPFAVNVGVHQGSTLSPFLFNLVMNHLTKDIQSPVPWCLLYADDIVLMDKNPKELQDTLQKWRLALETNGLRISRSKTEHLECNFSDSQSSGAAIMLDAQPLPKVQKFNYLGSMLTTTATVDEDVTHRVNTAWL
ncbi:jg24071 [Pararge aegeria aegeria]|uniref:Jg24071 protein n=1 Tax=Pararge aegeria aegeria TaxID=348720 RepID=A0A8S4QG15_9NEOP|nr:jg24071 [Pararge aegeria aegeria]